jgi:hypothetical protein
MNPFLEWSGKYRNFTNLPISQVFTNSFIFTAELLIFPQNVDESNQVIQNSSSNMPG